MMKEDGSCKGIGFVNYLEVSAAQAAIMSLHGTQLSDGSTLTVKTKAEPKTGPTAPCKGKGKAMNGGKGEPAAAAIGWSGAGQGKGAELAAEAPAEMPAEAEQAAWGQDQAWASQELENMLAQMT